jgi:hypothetical protein
VQERVTAQVADALMAKLEPRGAIVVVEAEHLCMSMRGVQKPAPAPSPPPAGASSRLGGHPGRGDEPDPRAPEVWRKRLRASRSAAPGVGVGNVTPDSFSDGFPRRRSRRHGLQLSDDGADLLDVGGESTRPARSGWPGRRSCSGCCPSSAAVAAAGGRVVDTTAGRSPARAGRRRAQLVNDVSGGLADPHAALVAQREVPYVAMHWRGHSDAMQQRAQYDDVVGEVCRELGGRRDAALAAGISPPGCCSTRVWASRRSPHTAGRWSRPCRRWSDSVSPCCRRLPQGLPRHAAGRPRRRAPAACPA